MIIKIFFVCIAIFSIIFAQPKEIASGVCYEHLIIDKPVMLSMHILDVDPKLVKIIIEASHSKCVGAEKTSSMVIRKNAIAAINGGFFDFCPNNKIFDFFVKFLDFLGYQNYNAYPIWARKIKNLWFSTSSKYMPVMAWSENNPNVQFDKLACSWNIKFDNISYPVAAFNKPHANGPILYNSAYDYKTPKKNNCIDVVIENGIVKQIIKGNGLTIIPQQGFVYRYMRSKNSKKDFSNIKIGAAVSIDISCRSKSGNLNHNTYDYILGSMPLLLENGAIKQEVLNSKSTFYTNRHPRTAIGILPNGHWLLLVVDGRQKLSAGITLPDLAEFFKAQSCTTALNLGGGGDCTMVIGNKIVNSPSARRYSPWHGKNAERPISDALLIMPK